MAQDLAPSPLSKKKNSLREAKRSREPSGDNLADLSLPAFDPMWPNTEEPLNDLRQLSTGIRIPTEFYADQPFLTPTADGGLLCVLTTGSGHEGSRGQHVLAMKTFDYGKTWQDPVPLESPDAPESSWGVPVTTPSGRVFIFYIFNADDIRELPADNPPYPGGLTRRMDSHGHYVFRWSDDHGRTWSRDRGVIPIREFDIDRRNPTKGAIRLFWNVSKPFWSGGSILLPVHKVGGFGEGWFTSSEGALLRSDNLATVANPLDAVWETLPEGEIGIRSPRNGGPIAEEHSFVLLSDRSIFSVFRTIDGHPACAYSRDEGRSWEPSEYMRFANGRLMKHPRAANFVWSLSDGGFLYFFHNHGGNALRAREDRRTFSYNGRNPIWFCRGWEEDGETGKRIAWSQPEVAFYDDDPLVRISYPDCIEHHGQLLFTQTQKNLARIHKVPDSLVNALSADPGRRLSNLKNTRPILDWSAADHPRSVPMPPLPLFVVRDSSPPFGSRRQRRGFAIRMALRMGSAADGTFIESAGSDGSGLRVLLTARRTVRLELDDGEIAIHADSDPISADPLPQWVTINVDGGSGTIFFSHNGAIHDGGSARQYGWRRINPYYRNSFRSDVLEFPQCGHFSLERVLIYDRILMSAEIESLDTKPTHA